MSLKAFILSALFSATTICGMAQESDKVYSQNKEAKFGSGGQKMKSRFE